jgi:(methylthio)acryloyl-CoA hydratase
LPEGQRGIFVGGGASVRLPKLMGMARMADMMFTGRVITSGEGNTIGITQYLVEDGKGLEKGIELATKISGNAGMTNYALMHVLPRIVDASQDQALMMESLVAAIAQNTPEAKARLKQFLEGKAKKVGE